MGPVNLVAIEEYEETEQRHQFLTTQHDDLVKAKAQLLEVINRINTQTRQMFTETFEKIRDNFRAMFTRGFRRRQSGPDARRTKTTCWKAALTSSRVRPANNCRRISLLSGGEQTMTAVSLLFSIYQVKPSPFCVLDELDAPLDESNINRFMRVLQRFLAHSQFIIITHNKRTIGMADVLYGVTMEEHGVSKIVSVKFHKAERSDTRPKIHAVGPARRWHTGRESGGCAACAGRYDGYCDGEVGGVLSIACCVFGIAAVVRRSAGWNVCATGKFALHKSRLIEFLAKPNFEISSARIEHCQRITVCYNQEADRSLINTW